MPARVSTVDRDAVLRQIRYAHVELSAVRIVCVVSVIKRLSFRPSVCPVDRQQQRRPAGLLLRSGAGSRYRSMAAAAVRLAGRVNFGPTVRRSSIIVPPPFSLLISW